MFSPSFPNNKYSPLAPAEIQTPQAMVRNRAGRSGMGVACPRHGAAPEEPPRGAWRAIGAPGVSQRHRRRAALRLPARSAGGKEGVPLSLSLAQAEWPPSLGVACTAGAARALQSRQD